MSFACERILYPLVLTFTALALVPACAGSQPADASSQETGGADTAGSSATGGNGSTGGSKSTAGSNASGGNGATGGSKSTGGASAGSAPTWSELFANYFASGTPGNCVGSGCHSAPITPSFSNASTMCSSMKSLGIIGNGTASFESVLKWFNQGGKMPMNSNPTPPNAVADIEAWTRAGAVCP